MSQCEAASLDGVVLPLTTVLWIDDELRREDAIVRLWELEGLQVDIATTGAEGLRLARTRQHDAIVLDLRLDDMYGLTLLRRLVAAGLAVPVVVVTGCYGESEVEVEALTAGAVAFKRKPLDALELRQILQSAIDGGQGQQTERIRRRSVPAQCSSSHTTAATVDPRVTKVLERERTLSSLQDL
jgi:DNA-binding response OmpR family regulator